MVNPRDKAGNTKKKKKKKKEKPQLVHGLMSKQHARCVSGMGLFRKW